MKIPKTFFGDAFTVLVLLLATGAFVTNFFDASIHGAVNDGSPLLQAIWACIYVVVLARAFRIRHQIFAVLHANKPLVFLIALTVVSTAWSEAPGITFRRSIATVLSTLFAIDLAARYPLRKQVSLIWFAVMSLVVLSALVEIFLPGVVPKAAFGNYVSDDAGWNGLFSHKNSFGHILALGVALVIVRTPRTRGGYVALAGSLALIFALIAATQSRTALSIALIMLILWPVSYIFRWKTRMLGTLGVATALIAVIVIFIGLQAANSLAGLMGRSSDLTGRTEMWPLCIESIARRPLLGYGFSAFWNVSEDSTHIRSIIGWDAPHAHNAYIDTTLQLGLIGLAACLQVAIVAMKRAISYYRDLRTPEALWPLACILFNLLYGYTESDLLVANWLSWMLFVDVVCLVSMPVESMLPISAEESKLLGDVPALKGRWGIAIGS